MRIEVLIDQEAKVSAKVIDALQAEVQRQISPLFPRFTLRIAKSSNSLVQVTGTTSTDEHKQIMDVLERIWADDSWLPE
ncbi:hypothetical protein AN237_26080 (plasmid) [Raoultella ornithinolytica]|uniref:DinI-like family protein n=1 Tax=Raoultella ornithinolytica TaxID=54291 RepID=UPI000849EDDC|nr:DinI-like family protein [Raoultella ornithinolytica]AOO60025.1 hypothetical protein AN237_26080 [Raoultella ornithinolytica]